MAFYNNQLQNIFNLENGHSVVLDQGNNESLLIKLQTSGFDHTFLLMNNYVMGKTEITDQNLNLESLESGTFVIAHVPDIQLNDLAKFLFHYHKDTAINILKNLTNPYPVQLTPAECNRLVTTFSPYIINASLIQKRAD